MRTLRHLASETGITPQDISASPWDLARGVFMSPEVVRFAEEQRFFRQAIDERTELIGAKDKSLRVPYSTAHQAITARTTGEGSGVGEYGKERTYTEMSSLDTMDITPSYKLGGVGIDKELLGTTRVDLIKEAKFILIEDIEEGIESAITDAYDTAVTTNVVYGGDATTPATLETGDKFTLDLLADAIQKLGTKWKPSLLFISSYQRAILHKSSQFTNAAEYGSNEVVLNGEIGKYLGIKVIETDLVRSYPVYASGPPEVGLDLSYVTGSKTNFQYGVASTSCQLIGTTRSGRKPGILAWKEKPSVDYEYLKRKATHYLLSDVAYGVGIVHEKACCLIKVTNA